MPRMRPIRTTAPSSGDVIVELATTPAPQIIYGSSTPAAQALKAADLARQGVAAASSSILVPSQTVPLDQPRIRPAPAVGPADDDDEIDPLEALRATEKRARERVAQEAATREAQLTQWGQEQATRAAQATQALTESQADTLASAISAAEAEAEQAEEAMIAAKQRGDIAAEVKAQRVLMKAERRLETLQAGHDEIQQQLRQKPAAVLPPAPPQGATNVEVLLSRMPNLMAEERDWIRKHPDSIANPANQQRMQTAFLDAQQRGLERGSEAYFAFFDDRLGYKVEDDDMPVAEPTRRVAAPVSRSAGPRGGSNLKPGQVMLTAEQREAARISGVSEAEYARGVLQLREAQSQGLYGYAPQK